MVRLLFKLVFRTFSDLNNGFVGRVGASLTCFTSTVPRGTPGGAMFHWLYEYLEKLECGRVQLLPLSPQEAMLRDIDQQIRVLQFARTE